MRRTSSTRSHSPSIARTATDVPAPTHRPTRLRCGARHARWLQPPLPAVPRGQRHGQGALRSRRLARPAARAGAAHRVLRQARGRSGRAAAQRVRHRHAVDGQLAAGQAALHRLAHRSPPARAGRDLLQLGHRQAAAPQLLPQRLHLRASGGEHRIHRERRAGGAAHLPRLLPDARDDARHLAARGAQLPAAGRVREPRSRRAPGAGGAACPRRAAVRAVDAARQLPDPGAVVAVLSQQGRLPGGQDRQRLRRGAVCAGHPAHGRRQAAHRHGDVQRGRAADPVQLRPRVLHGRHGDSQRLRRLPAHPDAARAALRAVQRAGAAEAGQEHVLPRLPAPPAALERFLSHRPGHQGHGHAGVRSAQLPVRVQGDQGFLPAAEGHHPRADHGQVPARQAARPRRAHGRHAWSTATWPFHARASRAN